MRGGGFQLLATLPGSFPGSLTAHVRADRAQLSCEAREDATGAHLVFLFQFHYSIAMATQVISTFLSAALTGKNTHIH